MSFEQLGLSPALLRALAELEYTIPTPVQLAAIPHVLAGQDLLAGAQTGTGKTAAFALPMLDRLMAKAPANGTGPRRVRALILTPTRELAAQVHESVRAYGRHLGYKSMTVFGGVGMGPQLEALRRGVDILVATPGRLLDHLERRSVNLSNVEIVVLDEADRMLDMGFLPAMKRVLAALPKQRQTLMFSATFSTEIKALAAQFQSNPAEVQIAARNTVVATITHRMHPVDTARKKDLLLHLLERDGMQQSLVFSRTKHGADKLTKALDQAGFKAVAIHGNKSQGARTRALSDFKRGAVHVLVATDIAARGLDIDQLPIVINYDLPMVAEDYIHRIGRTGRAGAEGQAISLVSNDESGLLRDIERLLKRELMLEPIAGFEPSINVNRSSNNRPVQQRPQQRNARPAAHARRPHAAPPRHAHAGRPQPQGNRSRRGRDAGRG